MATTTVTFEFKAYSALDAELQSISNIYPPLTSVPITAANYGADGGEFTSNTSNNGFNCDGGNLDVNAAWTGIAVMEGGNFDTGATVTLPAPITPIGAPSGNNSVDPEADYGIVVVDSDDEEIPTYSLPEPVGSINPIYPLLLVVNAINYIKVDMDVVIKETQTWNYGFFGTSLGYAIDMGTFATPNPADYDFGSLSTGADPILSSYVF